MKKLLAVTAVLFCVACIGQDLNPPPGLEWLTPQLVAWVESLPKVGPIVLIVFKYVGFVAAFFTALTTFVIALLQAARGFAWVVGLQRLSDGINALQAKIMPYLAYLSIFNAPQRAKELP